MTSNHPANHIRVVVTGMGAVGPFGNGVDVLWDGVLRQRVDIGLRPDADPEHPLRCRLTGMVKPELLFSESPASVKAGGDPSADLLTMAVDQALCQSGVRNDPSLSAGVPVIIGTGAGPTHALYEAYRDFFHHHNHRMRPTTVPRCMANSLSSRIAISYRLTGPNYVVVSACASATVAIGTAFRMLRCGLAERALCGGVETVSDAVTAFAWDRLGVLTRSDDPASGMLPFDRRRDGFVLGEGAGALVLETLAAARRRGAAALGEIIGYGESSDGLHLTQPDAEGQARAVVSALDDARIGPGDVDLIVAHGTATPANDRAESRAMRQALGADVGRVPVLALKPLWGHLLGASGAIESLVALQSLNAGVLPPDPVTDRVRDPECDLNFCPHRPVVAPLRHVVKNSFAFGGNNAVLVFRRCRQHDCP